MRIRQRCRQGSSYRTDVSSSLHRLDRTKRNGNITCEDSKRQLGIVPAATALRLKDVRQRWNYLLSARAAATQVDALESTAHFPSEMEELRRGMEGVANYNGLRQQLTADMADSSQR